MRGGKVMVHRFADGRLRFSYTPTLREPEKIPCESVLRRF
jgi:hypothetical protein